MNSRPSSACIPPRTPVLALHVSLHELLSYTSAVCMYPSMNSCPTSAICMHPSMNCCPSSTCIPPWTPVLTLHVSLHELRSYTSAVCMYCSHPWTPVLLLQSACIFPWTAVLPLHVSLHELLSGEDPQVPPVEGPEEGGSPLCWRCCSLGNTVGIEAVLTCR